MANEILTNDPVPIGEKVIDLICLGWASKRPIILRGPHGMGKSEIVEQAAKALDIEYRCMDLSIMEPPDLLGMPKIEGNSLKYFPPVTLPQGEKIRKEIKNDNKKSKKKAEKKFEMIANEGLLCFEELNRCDDAMQAPCLQLLTARKLNEYELPSGWAIIACINPSGDQYNVNDIDPALLSRFMVVDVCAGKKEWLKWSKKHDVHEAVVSVINEHPDPFNVKTGVPPRTWHYVSQVLNAFNNYEGLNEDIRRNAINGYLNIEWGGAVVEALIDMGEMDRDVLKDDDDDELIDPQSRKKEDKLPQINELVAKYTATYRPKVRKMSKNKISANMELLANTFNNKQSTTDAEKFCNHILKQRHTNNLNKLFDDIPNESKQVFVNSLNANLRDAFELDMGPGESVEGIKVKDPEDFKSAMGVAVFYRGPLISGVKKGRGRPIGSRNRQKKKLKSW